MTNSVKYYWVKKYISEREWNNYYSQISSYYNLGFEGIGKNKRLKIAFIVANRIPVDCIECNEEELLHIDNYRRANNNQPFPLEKIGKKSY